MFTLRRLLTNVKGIDKPEDRPGAVDKIKRSNCQATYIGETDRKLTTRLNEHKRAAKKGDLNNNIAEHHLKALSTGTKRLTYSTDYYQRITLEIWLTNSEKKCPKSLSTSSRTLQTFTHQELVTHCLLFILQPSICITYLRTRLHSQSHHAFTHGYSTY